MRHADAAPPPRTRTWVRWRWTLGLALLGAVLSMKRAHVEVAPLLVGMSIGASVGFVLGSLLGVHEHSASTRDSP